MSIATDATPASGVPQVPLSDFVVTAETTGVVKMGVRHHNMRYLVRRQPNASKLRGRQIGNQMMKFSTHTPYTG